jgi:hypothetical protein
VRCVDALSLWLQQKLRRERIQNQKWPDSEILSSRGGEYENDSFPGNCVVRSRQSTPEFQRFLLPPSSRRSPQKRRSTSTRLHDAISQKAVNDLIRQERMKAREERKKKLSKVRKHVTTYLGYCGKIKGCWEKKGLEYRRVRWWKSLTTNQPVSR